MEDDIFLQLSNLLNDDAPSAGNGGFSREYGGAEDSTMFAHDSMVSPDIKPKKSSSGRHNIVVIDDDFSTLDLMKIYLQRDFDVEVFDNPKNEYKESFDRAGVPFMYTNLTDFHQVAIDELNAKILNLNNLKQKLELIPCEVKEDKNTVIKFDSKRIFLCLIFQGKLTLI